MQNALQNIFLLFVLKFTYNILGHSHVKLQHSIQQFILYSLYIRPYPTHHMQNHILLTIYQTISYSPYTRPYPTHNIPDHILPYTRPYPTHHISDHILLIIYQTISYSPYSRPYPTHHIPDHILITIYQTIFYSPYTRPYRTHHIAHTISHTPIAHTISHPPYCTHHIAYTISHTPYRTHSVCCHMFRMRYSNKPHQLSWVNYRICNDINNVCNLWQVSRNFASCSVINSLYLPSWDNDIIYVNCSEKGDPVSIQNTNKIKYIK